MSFVLFIAVLVILIIVHELGHFLVAKFFKIGVDEFGIGYPPRAFTIGKFKGTTYTINWLPFGGFVRIFGERLGVPYSDEDKKRAFVHKPKLIQASVLVAGVVFNLIFAWILFSITLMAGAPTAITEEEAIGLESKLIVSSIVVGSPADVAGLKAGDTITALTAGDDEVLSPLPSEVSGFIASHAGEAVQVSYNRNMSGGTEVAGDVEIIPSHGVIASRTCAKVNCN